MYESIMWTYIREEQPLLTNLLKNDEVSKAAEALSSMEALYFVAHGSSYNAASAIAPLLTKLAKIRVYIYTPSQVLHNEISLFREDAKVTYVCGISQTGTSRGTLEALDYIKSFHFPVIGITDGAGSPLEEKSDVVFHLNCKGEDSNAKTKGYSSTLLVLCKMAIELALHKGIIDRMCREKIYSDLSREISKLNPVAQKVHDWCRKNQFGLGMSHLYVIGNGINYATAMEGQLKLMETVCIPTMFSNIEEFSHGMHRSLKKDSYILLLDTEKDSEMTERTFRYLKDRNMKVLMLSTHSKSEEESVILLPDYDGTDSVFLVTIAVQIISVFVPEINGEDPNRYANDDYTLCVETRVKN